jgi:hypothetical protein
MLRIGNNLINTKTIFLSSTSKELQDYRSAVRMAISKLDGYTCIAMEEFGSRDENSLNVCLDKLKGCDLFVGITGALYGSSPKGNNKSFTELEYDYATNNNIPKLMFLTSNDFPVSSSLRESDNLHKKQSTFREKVGGEHVFDKAESPDKLSTNVMAAIQNKMLKPEIELNVPTGSYVLVIEDELETNITIEKVENEKTPISNSFKTAKIIKKITIINTITQKIYAFDFTTGFIPKGVEFTRCSGASYNISNFQSERKAKVDEPRFITSNSKVIGLLIEPTSTNYVNQSSFEKHQYLIIDKGEYTIQFRGDGNIELKGAVNTKLSPNTPFTFHASTNNTQLTMLTNQKVQHLQLESGKIITSDLETEICPVTRAADLIKLTIVENELSENVIYP